MTFARLAPKRLKVTKSASAGEYSGSSQFSLSQEAPQSPFIKVVSDPTRWTISDIECLPSASCLRGLAYLSNRERLRECEDPFGAQEALLNRCLVLIPEMEVSEVAALAQTLGYYSGSRSEILPHLLNKTFRKICAKIRALPTETLPALIYAHARLQSVLQDDQYLTFILTEISSRLDTLPPLSILPLLSCLRIDKHYEVFKLVFPMLPLEKLTRGASFSSLGRLYFALAPELKKSEKINIILKKRIRQWASRSQVGNIIEAPFWFALGDTLAASTWNLWLETLADTQTNDTFNSVRNIMFLEILKMYVQNTETSVNLSDKARSFLFQQREVCIPDNEKSYEKVFGGDGNLSLPGVLDAPHSSGQKIVRKFIKANKLDFKQCLVGPFVLLQANRSKLISLEVDDVIRDPALAALRKWRREWMEKDKWKIVVLSKKDLKSDLNKIKDVINI